MMAKRKRKSQEVERANDGQAEKKESTKAGGRWIQTRGTASYAAKSPLSPDEFAQAQTESLKITKIPSTKRYLHLATFLQPRKT